MVQAIWSTANGRPLEATSLQGEQFVRLGAHFDPVLALLAPFWLVWPSPHMLLALQAVVTALGALPLFWLARKHIGSGGAALALALAYLLAPALHWQTLSEFHAVALATPLLLFAIWYLDEGRLVPFAIFAALACATKEHVGLIVAALGVWFAVSHRRPAAGAAIAAAGIAVTAVAVAVVIPHFSPVGESSFYGRYEEIGGGPAGIARTVVTDPTETFAALTERRDATYVFQLLVPVAALCLLAPLLLVAALPELLLNLLSETRTQTSIHFHYSAASLAVVYAATALGVAKLARARERLRDHVPRALVAVSLAATVALGALPLWAAVPGGETLGADATRVTAHDRIAERALERVPAGVAVSASNALGGHLSDRRRILSFPYLEDAAWVAVDETAAGYSDRVAPLPYAAAIARLRRDARWELVLAEDGVLLFRRR